jgi:hypothetical protein
VSCVARYLHFGIQLFETGRIEDYLVANPYWEEVRPMTSLLWEDYHRRFRPTYLHLMERFPKDPVKPMDQANAVHTPPTRHTARHTRTIAHARAYNTRHTAHTTLFG